ncbi:MAG: erythromycin esterase family protein [Bacillota bacterium]|nr:erythromycin esterase family protein [Bacillota bacterium]
MKRYKILFLSFIAIFVIGSMTFIGYTTSVSNRKTDWQVNNSYKINLPSSNDYRDLNFLKKVLKGKQFVFLGESVHGVAEYSSSKVRLIKYLHENLGYDVIAFESGLGDAAVTPACMNTEGFNSTVFMKNTIYGVWTSTETRQLFDYILKTQDTNPLVFAGFDVQSLSTFGNFMTSWLKQFNPEYAALFSKLELDWRQGAFNEQKLDDKELKRFVEGYNQAISIVNQHSTELQSKYSKNAQLKQIIIQTLTERIQFMERKNISNTTFDDVNSLRDKMMEENILWLSKVVYPGEKIIFWGHNQHIRDNNTQIYYKDVGQAEFQKWTTKSMFQDLPNEFKKKSYTIGFYMHDGKFFSPLDNMTHQVNNGKSFSKNDLEYILNNSKYDYTFINLEGHTKNNFNSWMDQPIYAHTQGLHPEKLTPSKTYDGIFFIKHVTPQDYIQSKH